MTALIEESPVAEHGPARAVVLILALGSMIGILNQIALGPFMVEISRELDTSAPLLGQITALVFLGSTVVSLLIGPLGDQYGRKRLILLGLLLVSLSAVGSMLAPTYEWLLVTRLLSAVSGGFIAGSTMATATSLFSGDDRRRALSTIASGIAIAPIIGIPALTFIASLSSWRLSFGVLGLLAGVWTLLAWRTLADDHVLEAGGIEVSKILGAYRPILGERSMLVLYGSTLTRAIGWVGMLTYLGAYLGEELGLGIRGIGWAMMVTGGAYFLGTRLTGGSIGNIGLRPLFGLSTSVCALCLGLSISLPLGLFLTLALLMVAAFCGGVGFVALLALVSSESLAGQGATMSLNSAMFTLGASLGAFFGSLLLAAGGFSAVGLGLMGFTLLAAALVWRPARLFVPAPGRSATAD